MAGKAKDISGQRFGRLTVIRQVKRREYLYSGTNAHWLCRCDCGNDCVVASNSLVTGNTKSCGCLRVETSRESVKKIAEKLRVKV